METKDIYPRAEFQSDDPRVEFQFKAQPYETCEGYCARRAIERAWEVKELRKQIEAERAQHRQALAEKDNKLERLREAITRIRAMMDAGELVEPHSITIRWKPAKHAGLDTL